MSALVVSEFRFNVGALATDDMFIHVYRVGRPGDPDADVWAIRDGGRCLNRAGAWEYEPLPSSRDAEFIDRTRFPQKEALRRAKQASEVRRMYWQRIAREKGLR